MYEELKEKINDLNKKPLEYRNEVMSIVSQLLDYISGTNQITIDQLSKLIQRLTAFTTGIAIPIDIGVSISRAVKYNEKNGDYYDDASRLSYIPKELSHLVSLQRMNEANNPMFYGCLDDHANSIGTALSEIDARTDDKINMLFSKITQELMVIPIGVFDYFRRGAQHPFPLHDDFEKMYLFYKKYTNPHAMIALHLCDAFLTDVLTREGNERLYTVTSLIAKDFLIDKRLDGLIYPSVKFSGHPNIVIKPSSVDLKLEYTNTSVLYVKQKYEYGIYETIETHRGVITHGKIKMEELHRL